MRRVSERRPAATDSHLPPADPREAAPLPFDLRAARPRELNVAARSIWCARCFGWKRYAGSVEAICRAVLEDCWTGEFFAGSAGHFKQFWTRDLAMCTPALCRLGYARRVSSSLGVGARALRAGRAHHHDHLLRAAFPRDVYAYALRLAADAAVRAAAPRTRSTSSTATASCCPREVDALPRDRLRSRAGHGAPRRLLLGPARLHDRPLDGVRQHDDRAARAAARRATRACRNPLAGHDIRGAHACAPLDGRRTSATRSAATFPSGDANVWPFFFGIFDDREMQRRALRRAGGARLHRPVAAALLPAAAARGGAAGAAAVHAELSGRSRAGRSSAPSTCTCSAEVDRPRMEQHRAAWRR